MIHEIFTEAYAKIVEANRRQLLRLDTLLAAFEQAGIEFLPLKGADLLGRVYAGALGLRPMTDVDLLFHRDDIHKIERILIERGFRPCQDGNLSYVSPDGALLLDMISDIWYLKEIGGVWKRAAARPVAGRIRRVMHPEDALIYLVAYQTIHRGRLDPQMAKDAAALIHAEKSLIDWHRIIEEIDACGLRIPLHHGLSYVRDAGSAEIPAWVFDALDPPASERRAAALFRRLVTEKGVAQLGYLLLVISRPGWRNKLHALGEALFPPKEFLKYRYGEKDLWNRARIRVTRPFYLAYNGMRVLFRAGRYLIFS